jgi:hypothetical protein
LLRFLEAEQFFSFLISSIFLLILLNKKMMKKICLWALALMAGLNLSAQFTIDFESTILPSNSYNNGADLSGGFTYDGIHFSNYYDTTYFYNLGFAISNQTDNLTPGWGNSYSSVTGNGHNSANYAIFYP